MSTTLLKFRNEMKSIFETGYTLQGEQFLGTSPGETLRVNDYMGVDTGFTVVTKFPKREEFAMQAPWISIALPSIDHTEVVGGHMRFILTGVVDYAFAQEHNRTIDASLLEEEDLAFYFEEQIRRAMGNIQYQFQNVSVRKFTRIASSPQDESIEGNLVYGGRIYYMAEVQESA